MRWLIDSSRLSLAVVVVLVGLLAVLASLQYRLIAQLSDAERARLQEDLDHSAAGFAEDFDNEVARAFAVFNLAQGGSDDDLARLLSRRWSEWRSTATWPELVKELVVLRLLDNGEVALLCLDEPSETLLPCNRDDVFLPIRRSLRDPRPTLQTIDGVLPGLILAIQMRRPSPGDSPLEWRPPRDHLIVRFDRDVITETILPLLAANHFAQDGDLSYDLRVSSDDMPGETIYQSGAVPRTRVSKPVATGRFFGLRSPPRPADFSDGESENRRPPPRGQDNARRSERLPPNRPPPVLRGLTEEGRWVLTVRHPAGSLEDVVAKARRRNMAISAAMLVMLGFTAVLMVASTRRARRLARQQMDFVAAVSHELRTPLTAIRSAGQNLADGIIDDPSGVQKYGLLIEREGRRLTEMIGRVLTYAGIRSGRQIYRMEPVDIGEVVRATLQDGDWVLKESGFVIETEIADGLPLVDGDKTALRQVITNLIDNALKYAADGRWLGVGAGFDTGPGGGEVRITISDRGPGVPRKELVSVFEPFSRGEKAGSGVPGSGLGLAVVRSIVKAHGGAIDVTSPPGGGAVFTIRLPAVSDGAVERGERR